MAASSPPQPQDAERSLEAVPTHDELTAGELRAAIGHFATGVSVVTSVTEQGEPIGSTANAVSSVSLAPPLLLVCLREESDTLAALLHGGRFAVNILAEDQRPLADHFAARTTGNTWRGVGYRLSDRRVPLLDGAVATLECTLHDVADGGDHRIVVGRVLDVIHPHRHEHVAPLLFFRGEYSLLGEAPATSESLAPDIVEAAHDAPALSELTGAPDVLIPTLDGNLSLVPVEPESRDHTSVIALVGEPRASHGALVYVHQGCLWGDALGHLECRRRAGLERALARMRAHGAGVVVYHRDDSSPFSGCCLPSVTAPVPTDSTDERGVPALLEALAQLDLNEVTLLRLDGESEDPGATTISLDVSAHLDVATIESLD